MGRATRMDLLLIVIMEWWWGIGYHTVSLLVGLAAVKNAELMEAARVDGAGTWRVFWRVVLPALRPILLVLIVIRPRFSNGPHR